ncbi:MAG: DUF1553 domain-containing protein [Planctomycetota bacterium]|nr:MAG: DUF1553 domain-containing protein [Planctomycetota bacterium]
MDLMRRLSRPLVVLAGLIRWGMCVTGLAAAGIDVQPSRVTFDGDFQQCQFVVRDRDTDDGPSERSLDLTHRAAYSSADPTVATVSATGCVTAVGNGTTRITIARISSEGDSADGSDEGSQPRAIEVEVRGMAAAPQADFDREILPVLTRAGCNAGACHASQHGKGGFVLSVMAFDPALDWNSIAVASRGRRVCPTNPDGSLLLQKATNRVPHGGGVRLAADSRDYAVLANWIGSGAPRPAAEPVTVVGLSVEPAQRLASSGQTQQLRVVARHSDGSERDVTAWTRFDCLDEAVVRVSSAGLVTTVGKGQGAVMARFGGEATTSTFVVPFSTEADVTSWTSNHPLDLLAGRKFRELGLTPSGICDDATFLRRASLDCIGGLPTVEESRAFLASAAPDKRELLIDRLLGLDADPAENRFDDRFGAWWSLKWADLIRNNSAVLGESGMWALHNWLRESFRTNKPLDRFVSELVTAQGSIYSNGPANYYRVANNPPDLAESTAQLFLGKRLQCAKCHHHPYERISQADYYGFAAYFARVATKSSAEFGIFGGETVVLVNSTGEVSHPRSGAVMQPTPLDGRPIVTSATGTVERNADSTEDRRVALARWLTSADNDAFARNIANRAVASLLGRGLVEPVDDMRSTNPPSNPEMLDALADEFRASGFDFRRLLRFIMRSRLYQLQSQPNATNGSDERFYSHYAVKRLGAEALLDCIDDATLVRTKHPNLPLGTRAIALPDAAAANSNPFLVTFGKPKRASVCECERTPDENLAQALHTLNGEIIAAKVADAAGRVAKLVDSGLGADACVEDIFLATLCRPPTTAEAEDARSLVAASPSPREGLEDLLWALINSKHFIFVR